MPNVLVKPKGPYELNKRFRHMEERQMEWNRHQFRNQKKKHKWRLLKLLSYYFAFYIFLAAFSIGYFIFLVRLLIPANHPRLPKGTGLSSVPGHFVGNVKLIRYKENQIKELSPYVEQLDKFVAKYGTEGMRHLRLCNLDNYWGYDSGLPCILLKLNFALNFVAVTYDDSITLPKQVPNDLYDYILELSEEHRTNRIWVACNFMDNQTIADIEYVPYRYYDSDGLFLKSNSFIRSISENLTDEVTKEDPAYRRVIGVQFHNLPVNQDVYVKCQVWAKNIPLRFATTVFVLHVEALKIEEKVEDDYSL
ncbi:hypothetical protein KR215_011702 [Drosophila sulfurigaster]|nr:hypothetical protein KR215_011702 [Drosophila sulfurigaster]